MNKISTRRAIAAAGVAGAALMGLSSLGAGGAAAGPLPGANVTKTLVDGTPVNIRLFDERVDVHPAVTNVPTSREVFTSGKIQVTVGGKATGGTIAAGYVVGCQLQFGASGQGATGNVLSEGLNDSKWPDHDASSAGGTFTLAPGQAVYAPTVGSLVGLKDSNSNAINAITFSGSTGGVAYGQEKFGVDGCAGYAQAQAKITVTVETDSVKGVVTAYGRPFSIG